MSNISNQQIHGDLFEDMIYRRGRKVIWREAMTCSCWNLDSGQPAYGCKVCHGLGHTYSEPVEDLALVMSVSRQKQYADTGFFEVGDAIMTVGRHVPKYHPQTGQRVKTTRGRLNPIFEIGQFDLITLTDDTYKTSEILTRGEDIYGAPADTLRNEDVVEVRKVTVSDPVTGETTRYEAGTDFEVVGNKIVWKENRGPEHGAQYAVQYTHMPMYTVLTQLPDQRFQDKQELPKKVVLRYREGGFDRR